MHAHEYHSYYMFSVNEVLVRCHYMENNIWKLWYICNLYAMLINFDFTYGFFAGTPIKYISFLMDIFSLFVCLLMWRFLLLWWMLFQLCNSQSKDTFKSTMEGGNKHVYMYAVLSSCFSLTSFSGQDLDTWYFTFKIS